MRRLQCHHPRRVVLKLPRLQQEDLEHLRLPHDRVVGNAAQKRLGGVVNVVCGKVVVESQVLSD